MCYQHPKKKYFRFKIFQIQDISDLKIRTNKRSHLSVGDGPDCEVDVLIVESTYGVQKHESRERREQLFTKYVTEIVTRGGKCLMPVFALGRA